MEKRADIEDQRERERETGNRRNKFSSTTAPLVEPCASTPAPNTVPPPASLSYDLPTNSASAPASNTPPHAETTNSCVELYIMGGPIAAR